MTSTSSKMICLSCGVEMNHHCDKLVYTANPQETEPIDPVLGGLIDEFHTCPECGGAASRHA